MTTPLVQLPLSDAAKRAAALRSTRQDSEGTNSMKEVTIPAEAETKLSSVTLGGDVLKEWTPECKQLQSHNFIRPEKATRNWIILMELMLINLLSLDSMANKTNEAKCPIRRPESRRGGT